MNMNNCQSFDIDHKSISYYINYQRATSKVPSVYKLMITTYKHLTKRNHSLCEKIVIIFCKSR